MSDPAQERAILRIGLILGFIIGLMIGCFIGEARAESVHEDIPGQRQIVAPTLEAVSDIFWARRGVYPPDPVELFVVPDEWVWSGRGELPPGHRVWMVRSLFRRTNAYGRCLIYLHERGHNAGLQHGVLPIMEPRLGRTLRIPLCLRYERLGGSL